MRFTTSSMSSMAERARGESPVHGKRRERISGSPRERDGQLILKVKQQEQDRIYLMVAG